MSDAPGVPSSVRDQLQTFISERCRSHATDIVEIPRSLAQLFENEPTRTTSYILAMRTTPHLAAPERELVVANLFCYALQRFPPPVCLAELASFAERHTGVGAPPEFRRLRSIVAIIAAAAATDSKLPAFGAGLHALLLQQQQQQLLHGDPDALNHDNSASFSSGGVPLHEPLLAGASGALLSLTLNSALLVPLGDSAATTGAVAATSVAASASLDLGSGGAARRRALVPTPLAPAEDTAACTARRNSELAGAWKVGLRPRIVKPYLEQPRLRINRERLGAELGVLTGAVAVPSSPAGVSSPKDGSGPSSGAAMLSSAVATLVKLTMDSYVAKLPLGSAAKLREASEALLHVLSTMLLRTHSFAVRQRAFDVMLNLAVHTQLVECSHEFRTRPQWLLLAQPTPVAGDTNPAEGGNGAAAPARRLIVAELEWVLARMLEQLPLIVSSPVTQIQVDASAARLLVAALKVTLMLVPPPRLHLVVPPCAMAMFLQLPVTRQCTVAVFDSLSEAACSAILGRAFEQLVSDQQQQQQQQHASSSAAGGDVAASDAAAVPLPDFSPAALEQFGGVQTVVDHLVAAPTSRSAACLFAILYCIHNGNVNQQVSASAFAVDVRPLRAALRIGLHWQTRFLLVNGEGVRAVPQLKRFIAQDLQRDPTLHRPLVAFISDLIAGSAAAQSAALCASNLPFSLSADTAASSAAAAVAAAASAKKSKQKGQEPSDDPRFKLFPPDMPAICRELSDPRNLASLLDDADAVVSNTTARLCAHALLYEWTCTACAANPAVALLARSAAAAAAAPSSPSGADAGSSNKQGSGLPPPTVTSALLAVSRVPSARSRAALLHLLRCLVVVLRARVPPIVEQVAAAATSAAASAVSAASSAAAASAASGVSSAGSLNASVDPQQQQQQQPAAAAEDAASTSAMIVAQCTAFITRRFALLVQQLLDVSCNAGPSASLPFVCGLTRIVLESCMQQFHATPLERDAVSLPPQHEPDDVVFMAFHKKVLVATPHVVESVGGVPTLWRFYKALRVVDEHSATLLSQPCCRLRLAVLRMVVTLVENHAFDGADVNNWRIALADPCGLCSAVAASYVVRAVSEPFDDKNEAVAGAGTTTYDTACRLLNSVL